MYAPRHLLKSALAAALVLGCGDSSGMDSGSTRVTVLLKDAPGDVIAAVVNISEIYLQRGDDADGSPRVVLFDRDTTVNLVDLVDLTAELTTVDIPSGEYEQLRFLVPGAWINVEGQGVYATAANAPEVPAELTVVGTLITPSFSQSGLKVNFGDPGSEGDDGVTLGDGETVIVTIDFDVAQSFGQQAGQSGNWVMRPAITGTIAPAP